MNRHGQHTAGESRPLTITARTWLLALASAIPGATAHAQCTPAEAFKISGSFGATDDSFGNSVAISGDIAIVGAHFNDVAGDGAGAAYLFDVTTGLELFRLTASDAAAFDLFGDRVAIRGNIAVVGAYWNDDAGMDSGAAYVFDVTTGQQLFKLTASDAAAGDRFGASVAVSDAHVLIGAPADDHSGFTNAGSIYVFDATTGQEVAWLTASDPADFDAFGHSLAASESTAIVGAPFKAAPMGFGAAYLFDLPSTQQLFKLTANGGQFGYSVAIDNQHALVGGNDAGVAILFDAATGQELFHLTGTDTASNDMFGNTVGISNGIAIVGASLDDREAGPGMPFLSASGSAYLFDASTGQQISKLTATHPHADDLYGYSVAISGNVAIIGAIFSDDRGAAYLIGDAAGAGPGVAEHPHTHIANHGDMTSLTATPSGAGPFTYRWRRDGVEINDDGRVTGAWSDHLRFDPVMIEDAASYDCVISKPCGDILTNAAILAVRPAPPCPGDTNASGHVDFDDLNAVLGAWGTTCP